MRFSGNKKKKIPIAAYKKKRQQIGATLKLRDLNSVSGTIGDAPRASTKTSAATHPAPTSKLPKTKGLRQPRVPDSRNPHTKPPSPTVARSAPAQSMCAPLVWLLSGIRHSEMTITATAIGTLMKNARRQEPCSTNQPPSTGPIALVIAVKPDHVPIARPRLLSSKNVL
jgi:hypothetical protein